MQAEQAIGAIALIVVLVALKAGTIGMAMWLHATYADRMGRIGELYRARATECFIVGLINTVVLFFIGLLLIGTKVLSLLGLMVWGVVIVMAVFGYSAAYRHVGERVFGPSTTAARTVLLGGITAEAAFLAPLIGQLFSIGVLLRGIGAVVLTVLSRKAGVKPIPATAEIE